MNPILIPNRQKREPGFIEVVAGAAGGAVWCQDNAARVLETIEGCLLAGLDVPKWIDRHLIDRMFVGNMAVEFNLRPFKTMYEKAAVRLYPCLYGWGNGYNPNPGTVGPGPDDMIRGTAAAVRIRRSS